MNNFLYSTKLFWFKEFKNQFNEYNDASALYCCLFMYFYEAFKLPFEQIVRLDLMNRILSRIALVTYATIPEAEREDVISAIKLHLKSNFSKEEYFAIFSLLRKYVPEKNDDECILYNIHFREYGDNNDIIDPEDDYDLEQLKKEIHKIDNFWK